MMLTPAVLKAANEIMNQWETRRADGARDAVSRFIGSDVAKFRSDARTLYDLVKQGEMDWDPDTSSMLRIKVAAEAILLAHARQIAGNSGSH